MSQRSGNVARVAVVGGGLSGLMCAVKLKQLGLDAVVYDTGKHAVGGRCSSRIAEVGGRAFVLDHSVQCFTAVSERFARVVGHWRAEGLVEEWHRDRVGTLRLEPPTPQRQQPAPAAAAGAGAGATSQPGPGRFLPRGREEPPLFICPSRGMRGLAEYLADSVTVQRPTWVGRLERRAPSDGTAAGGGRGGSGGGWDLYGPGGRHLGYFDYVVIAHNGKCADQLMSTAGVPAVHNLLRVKFCPEPQPQQQVMQLCSLWVLLVGFPSPLPVAWQGAFVEGSPVLSWAANNSAKIIANRQPPTGGGKTGGSGGSLEFWTLISTREVGSQHKVPQENIPPGKAREVTALMLEAFAAALGLPAAAPQLRPSYSRVQLWGAAVPLNVLTPVPERPCVLDAASRVGICGDWLHSPSLEGACLSGLALAEAIRDNWRGRSSSSIGLGPPRFRVVAAEAGAAPIGSFSHSSGSTAISDANHHHHQQQQQQRPVQQAPGPSPKQPQPASQSHPQSTRQPPGTSPSQPPQDWPALQPQPQAQPQPQPQAGRPMSARQGWIRAPGAGAAIERGNAPTAVAPPPAPPSPPPGQQPFRGRHPQPRDLDRQTDRQTQQQQQQQGACTQGPGAAGCGASGGNQGGLEDELAAVRLTAPASRNARRRAAKRAQQAAGAGGGGGTEGGGRGDA